MPAMGSITVKKHDGATNAVYSALQAGGSDRQRPAIWNCASVGTAYSHRPEVRYSMRQVSASRKSEVLTAQYPSLSTDTTTGITTIIGRGVKLRLEIEVDQSMPQADINEATSQFLNFFADPIIRQAFRNGEIFTG